MDARALGPSDVICSYFTLAGSVDGPRDHFEERVAAVAGAGYAAMGLMAHDTRGGVPQLADYHGALASGLSDADLVSILDDHGTCVAEIEYLSGWWFPDERGEQARQQEAVMLHMADVFGARHLNVSAGAASDAPADIEAAGVAYRRLCDRAADHGLQVAMEFKGNRPVKDVRTAALVLDIADRPNAGISLDSYHFFRSTSTFDELRALGAAAIGCIQLNDAAGPGEWASEEQAERRLLPGDGDFDLVGMLTVLDGLGVRTPPSVEILSLELWSKPLDERASCSYQATRRLLDALVR